MGKATGFIEYERENNRVVPPLERIKGFDEFRAPINEEHRKAQAARCMNCGVPFCQSGENFSGMVSGCPLHNLIPEWNDEIYSGNIRQALTRLIKTNNFPEFTGRVCPALCEAACTCGLNGSAVTVHENELAVIEKGFECGYITPQAPTVRTDKSVAIVGSGPAGLACADMLNKRGHNVTVFERAPRPGGLLMYGIPNMKLDKSVISRRVKLMEAEGVRFECRKDIGRDIAFDELTERFDAVVLCCGSKKPRDLSGAGREGSGVYFAVDYLTAATEKVIGDASTFAINAKGKNVVIVGGGDTGNDCVATAIRQGCRSVTQLEMMPEPPKERAADNLWPEWSRVKKTDYGQEEAIALFGHDPRRYRTTVKEFVRTDKGELRAVVTVKLGDDFKPLEAGDQTLKCELLLIAAGFVGCEDYVEKALGAEKTPRGTLKTADGSYMTFKNGVFAAGDVRRGQSLVVHAISEGRECAKEVDRYLMGYSNM